MKRKLSTSAHDDQEEDRLSNLLFTKPQDFADKLKPGLKDDFLLLDLKPAWIDEDDELFDANIVPDSKTKGLYKDTLKHRYEALIGTPNWARLDRVIHDSEEDKAIRSVGHLQKISSETLPKDILELQKFHDIKLSGNKQVITSCVAFHPTASVLLIGTRNGNVSLYSVSGDDNNLLHSFILKDQFKPIRAFFTPDGTEVYIGSRIGRYYCVYNLVKAEPKLVYLPDALKKSLLFEMSPDGKLLAASDGFDEIFLISTLGKELIRVLKHNNVIEAVTFSSDSKSLYSYSKQGEVSIWNLSTYRVIKKFQDHGCVTGSCIATSPCGRLLATGTGEGIVNIYELSNLDSSSPLPLKTIENLKTKITHMEFNPVTEILSISSSYYPNAVKLVHIPSYHVFQNFPEISVNVFQVESLGFSPNCGYMALGNNRGCVYLYRLKHYKNY